MLKKKKNLLKNLKVSSVDLCGQGANQESYICLKKSMGEEEKNKNAFLNKLISMLAKETGMPEEEIAELARKVAAGLEGGEERKREKTGEWEEDRNKERAEERDREKAQEWEEDRNKKRTGEENREKAQEWEEDRGGKRAEERDREKAQEWEEDRNKKRTGEGTKEDDETKKKMLKEAMIRSFESILTDESLDDAERKRMIQRNVDDFYQDVEELTEDTEKNGEKNQKDSSRKNEKNWNGKRTEFYGGRNREIGQEQEKNVDPIQKALEELKETKAEFEKLKKSIEMKEMEEVAKGYEVLGKDVGELAEKLYAIKKSGEDPYKEYLSALEELKEMQEKSGIFKEIGSSKRGNAQEQALKQRIQEIRKADSSLSYEAAYVKACEEGTEEVF